MAFIQLVKSEETEELIQHPREFMLLTLIAFRAKRTDSPSKYGLKIGDSMIGLKDSGLTKSAYRTVKKNLVKMKLVSFRSTDLGSVATLLDSSIYNVNIKPDRHSNIEIPENGKKSSTPHKQKSSTPLDTLFSLENEENRHTNRHTHSESDRHLTIKELKDKDTKVSSSSKSDIETFKSIIGHLNQVAEKKYKHSTSCYRRLIKARLKEGYRPEDFVVVIDKKCEEWKGSRKMEKHLNPITLFGSKFDTYLNQSDGKEKDDVYI